MKTKNKYLPSISIATLLIFTVISVSFVAIEENGDKKSITHNSDAIDHEATSGINWLTIEEAYQKNKVKKKKIFIDFYTSWCGWCKRMDKTTFADKSVSDYANKHYYAVKMDAESVKKVFVHEQNTTPRDIARSMYVTGYPTVVFIHDDFKTIDVQPGYKNAQQFLESLKVFNSVKSVAKKQ